jgi:hypothetical protein
MAKAFIEIGAASEADSLGHHEWLGLLLDREASWRRDKRLAARLRIAKLRQQASIEGVVTGGGVERLQSPIVEDEQIGAPERAQDARMASAVTAIPGRL